MKNRVLLITVFVILLVVLFGWFIFQNISNQEEKEGDLTTTATSTLKTTGDQAVSFEYVDDEGNPLQVEKVKISMPDLDAKIVFYEQFSESEKTKITNKMNEIIANLKKDSTSFDDWMELASYKKTIGDYQGAAEVWEYASALAPLNNVPLNNLGNLYHYELKNYPKSEQYLKQSIEIAPMYAITYISLFDLYHLSYKQDTDSAENVLLLGLENNPDQITLLATLAAYYEEKEDVSKAIEYYKKTADQAKAIGDDNLYDQLQNQINLLK